MADNFEHLAVVADIGGTNTRVALARDGVVDRDTIRRYRNAENASLETVLADYLGAAEAKPDAACVAMAGPVRDGIGKLTNLDWRVDKRSVAQASGATTVAVLNDLQAQGHALDALTADVLTPILPGQPASPQAAKLVVGVGTGLNAAPVFRLGGQTLVPPSETGHVSLKARNAEELRLRDWVARKHDMPGFEDVLSGRGFERIHAFLCDEEGTGTPMSAAEIMEAQGQDEQARRAVQLFTRLLGAYVGDLALITLPFGGVYLCGGVTQHFAPHIASAAFTDAFCDKGRFSEFMQQFPVHVLTDDYAALTGCACHLTELHHLGA
ncbi:Glucokinase [Roseivivax sp. THAF40]|uniref:glucokinase n=1 Tax=unclassified Roseivivax TaxID=2639302 RepID=UPI00126791CE|nr:MULTISPECIES: glucokinase [unclassified Roseivivax]QFS83099.1 Glucokinase [Roseivivax sp. THAF197b]QFT46843.1 Glucokinase [Roseivivax sp. THAF40]